MAGSPVVAREPGAGRELDALIAERVMGWTNIYGGYKNGPQLAGVPPVGKIATIPKFSTDIAAAWLVVEKMSTLGWAMGMDMQGPAGAMTYDVGFWNGREWFSDEADTAPLGICRAALEALAHPTNSEGHSASPSSTEPAE